MQEETRQTGKKSSGFSAGNLRLNVKKNGSYINQNQYWRIANVKYFETLESSQIRKKNF